MSNNLDYGFDVDTVEELNTRSEEETPTNEVGDRVSRGNEYKQGEKEAIEKWVKEQK